jgi:hypothetical protein
VHLLDRECDEPKFTVLWLSVCGWKQSMRKVSRTRAELGIAGMHDYRKMMCELEGKEFVPIEFKIVPYDPSQEPEF